MSSLSPRLEVDLTQIQENYLYAVQQAPSVEISAVVKANAYGLGAAHIAEALAEVGCKTFWVARTSEALTLRPILPEADIYVMGGAEAELLDTYRQERLRPVINTVTQLENWCTFAKKHSVEPVALHVETGFNRLALQRDGISKAQKLWEGGAFKASLVISHMACVDEPNHPKNRAQLTRFEEIKKLFPCVRASLSASYALLEQDPAFRQDLMRVGKILYGIRAPDDGHFITKPAILFSAPVVQIATVQKGDTVGYDATYTAKKKRRLATLAIGYADGIPRSMQEKGEIYFTNGKTTYAAPLTGRVSMDLLSCDVTGIPEEIVFEGASGYIIDKEHDVMRYTDTCGIMGYEAMTHFNDRIERVYTRR